MAQTADGKKILLPYSYVMGKDKRMPLSLYVRLSTAFSQINFYKK
jgi:hypothetical protein